MVSVTAGRHRPTGSGGQPPEGAAFADALGADRTTAPLIGVCQFVCGLLNAFDIPVPCGEG
jgi:hypothetical protein